MSIVYKFYYAIYFGN